MRLRIMSDLHIESNPMYRPQICGDEDITTLLLAGDVCEIEKTKKLISFLTDMSVRFKDVIYIFGNHEFYRGNISTAIKRLDEISMEIPNLHILDNSNVVLEEVNFIGCTLWTSMNNGNPVDIWDAQQGMNDYRYIRIGSTYRKLHPRDTVHMHSKSVKFIESALEQSKSMTNVILTHHLPCTLSVHERYHFDKLNFSYVTDLTSIMEKYNPSLWIHGHTHNSVDYTVYNTRVVCNPRGYSSIRTHENSDFDENLIVELGEQTN